MSKTVEIEKEITKVIKGKDEVVRKLLVAIIASGHVLLEDIPGVGKTTLAVACAKSMSLIYKRVQFTPDVLPSDIIGFSMYNAGTREFEYKEGSIMCNLFLADEINRTSPKTQSALLEVMEEGHVTVDGVTHEVPKPFTVIATENPLGSAGTQMLPDSQLDRFMCCLSMGYPSHEDAVEILKENKNAPIEHVNSLITKDELVALQKAADEVFVHDSLFDYVMTLVEKTRGNEDFMFGASPRAAISLLRMAKANAVVNSRDHLLPEDVEYVICDVLRHRLKMSTKAKANSVTFEDAISKIMKDTKIPRT